MNRRQIFMSTDMGPHQEQGNPLWSQGSLFQPWTQRPPNSPFWGMPMYGGFVQANYPSWVPSYQPGLFQGTPTWGMPYYSGFVNQHSMEGI